MYNNNIMLEWILVGFTGSFLSYYVVFELGFACRGMLGDSIGKIILKEFSKTEDKIINTINRKLSNNSIANVYRNDRS